MNLRFARFRRRARLVKCTFYEIKTLPLVCAASSHLNTTTDSARDHRFRAVFVDDYPLEWTQSTGIHLTLHFFSGRKFTEAVPSILCFSCFRRRWCTGTHLKADLMPPKSPDAIQLPGSHHRASVGPHGRRDRL